MSHLHTNLRYSFNKLAKSVFGIDFENYYKAGFWSDQYICYSFINEDDIVSNVSVNKIDVVLKGERIKAIQIGTVMTHPDFRGRGLAGKLLNYVIEKYEKDYELIYLFANKTVLDFYPKYGFQSLKQSGFKVCIDCKSEVSSSLMKLNISKTDDIEIIKKMVYERKPVSEIVGVENAATLFMFYCLYVFHDNIYYIKDLDSIVLFKVEDNDIHVFDIVSKHEVDFDEIIFRIASGKEKSVVFHFTPDYKNVDAQKIPLDDSEDTFFIRTKSVFIADGLLFPITGHS